MRVIVKPSETLTGTGIQSGILGNVSLTVHCIPQYTF
jgi:hypothetical protein